MNKNKISLAVSGIVLVIVIAITVYYLLPEDFGQEGASSDYFTLTVMSTDIPEEKIKEYQEQLSALKKAIEADPDFVNHWFDVGLLKKLVGDYQGAEAAWIKAGEIRPANSTSFGNLADLYANFLHEYDKAEVAYEIAIKNSAGEVKNLLFYRQYAEFAFYRLGDIAKTEEILLQAAEANPASSEPLIMLGSFYQDRGENQKAIDYYEQALEIDPEDDLTRDELNKLK